MSASLDLQDLILVTLKADTTLMAMINGVWDSVPAAAISFAAPKLAYISFGPHDYVEDDADCLIAGVHTFQLDAWSRTVGFPMCKQICDRVKAVLHEADLAIPTTNALAFIRVPSVRFMRDADGTTSHGIIAVTAAIEEL